MSNTKCNPKISHDSVSTLTTVMDDFDTLTTNLKDCGELFSDDEMITLMRKLSIDVPKSRQNSVRSYINKSPNTCLLRSKSNKTSYKPIISSSDDSNYVSDSRTSGSKEKTPRENWEVDLSYEVPSYRRNSADSISTTIQSDKSYNISNREILKSIQAKDNPLMFENRDFLSRYNKRTMSSFHPEPEREWNINLNKTKSCDAAYETSHNLEFRRKQSSKLSLIIPCRNPFKHKVKVSSQHTAPTECWGSLPRLKKERRYMRVGKDNSIRLKNYGYKITDNSSKSTAIENTLNKV